MSVLVSTDQFTIHFTLLFFKLTPGLKSQKHPSTYPALFPRAPLFPTATSHIRVLLLHHLFPLDDGAKVGTLESATDDGPSPATGHGRGVTEAAYGKGNQGFYP